MLSLHSRILFTFFISLQQPFVYGSKKLADKFVAGCPSEKEIDFSAYVDGNANATGDLPPCYCDNALANDSLASTISIKVACYVTSTLDDLTSTLTKVRRAGKNVEELLVSNMLFAAGGLPDGYFKNLGVFPKMITISVCNGNDKRLRLGNGTFDGLENATKSLKIYDCYLDVFPSSIRKLASLESLTIQQTFVYTLEADDIKDLRNLRHLDLSINQMYYVEPGTFEPLQKLETLILGPSNAFNQSILSEINRLKSLKFLDMSANSLGELPDNGFNLLPNLHTLDLQYNLIKRLRRQSFSGLKSLRNLYLTANQLNYTEFSAFDSDLADLETLYLQFNHLKYLDSKTFYNLKNLLYLDLSYNDLQGLKATSFDTNSKLKFLNFSNNAPLAIIEDGALNGAISLEFLDLHATNLSYVSENTFKGLKNLQFLNLSQTDIGVLDQSAFEDQRELKNLDLNSAKFTRLDENLLSHLSSTLLYLDLSNNRYFCYNESRWLVRFVQRYSVKNSSNGFVVNVDETECWMPLDYRGLSVSLLDPNTMTPIKNAQTDETLRLLAAEPLEIANVDQNDTATMQSPPSAPSTLPSANLFDFLAAGGNAAPATLSEFAGGFKTLAPMKNNIDGDQLDIKTLVASIVGAGVAVTALVVAVLVYAMRRRRRLKKAARKDADATTPSTEMTKRPESGQESHTNHESLPSDAMQDVQL